VGEQLVGDARATMDKVVTSVKQLATILGDFTAAFEAQSAGIDQVNAAVSTMGQITKQNASLIEDAALTAAGLRTQAATLAQAVSAFGSAGGADAPTARPSERRDSETSRATTAEAPLRRQSAA
jgi:methyl-accepting chemotaxis protein